MGKHGNHVTDKSLFTNNTLNITLGPLFLMTGKLPSWELKTITGAACKLSSEPYMARESDFVTYVGNHTTGTSRFPL